MSPKLRKILSLALTISLLFQQVGFAQIATELNIASHFSRMASNLTIEKFRPLHLRYFSYDSLNSNFKVLLDKGDLKNLADKELQSKTQTLLSYFLVGVSLPDSSFWVNLRPDSENSIIDEYLSKTDVGKIMLEADLQLKKDTSSMTSPATPEGREYWDKLYKKAANLYGNDNITIPTLTRPWIVPGEIIIRESETSAYIYKATLKVMLEEDYLKNQEGRGKGTDYSFQDTRSKALNEYSTQLIKELIIPKLTKEVNSSKRYAPLRQVYYSLILSRWFKQKYSNQKTEDRGQKNSYISLINTKDLTDLISTTSWSKTDYFNQYKKSFTDGEYSIKEPVYTPTGQTIRSYFSGGLDLKGTGINNPSGFTSSPINPSVLKTGVLMEGESVQTIKLNSGEVNRLLRNLNLTSLPHYFRKQGLTFNYVFDLIKGRKPDFSADSHNRAGHFSRHEFTLKDPVSITKDSSVIKLEIIHYENSVKFAVNFFSRKELIAGVTLFRSYGDEKMEAQSDLESLPESAELADKLMAILKQIGEENLPSTSRQAPGTDTPTSSPDKKSNSSPLQMVRSEEFTEKLIQSMYLNADSDYSITDIVRKLADVDPGIMGRLVYILYGTSRNDIKNNKKVKESLVEYLSGTEIIRLHDGRYHIESRTSSSPLSRDGKVSERTPSASNNDSKREGPGKSSSSPIGRYNFDNLQRFVAAGYKTAISELIEIIFSAKTTSEEKSQAQFILRDVFSGDPKEILRGSKVRFGYSTLIPFTLFTLRTGAIDRDGEVTDPVKKQALAEFARGNCSFLEKVIVEAANNFDKQLSYGAEEERNNRILVYAIWILRIGASMGDKDILGAAARLDKLVSGIIHRDITPEVKRLKYTVNRVNNYGLAKTKATDPAYRVLKKQLGILKDYRELQAYHYAEHNKGFGKDSVKLFFPKTNSEKEKETLLSEMLHKRARALEAVDNTFAKLSIAYSSKDWFKVEKYLNILSNDLFALPYDDVGDLLLGITGNVRLKHLAQKTMEQMQERKERVSDITAASPLSRDGKVSERTPSASNNDAKREGPGKSASSPVQARINLLKEGLQTFTDPGRGTPKDVFNITYGKRRLDYPSGVGVIMQLVTTTYGRVVEIRLVGVNKNKISLKDPKGSSLTQYNFPEEIIEPDLTTIIGIEHQLVTAIENELKDLSSGASSPVAQSPDKAGGIDFRSLPMSIQPMGSFKGLNFSLPKLTQAQLAQINIESEIKEIQNMVNSGIRPSGQRVKELLAACNQKKEISAKADKLLLCLINICKLEEENAYEASPELREALVIVDSIG